MQGLTKDNFWNDLHKDYPQAVDLFCQWIDDYKKEIFWNNLFCDGVKFDDLPFEMQVGILERFKTEIYNKKRGALRVEADQFVIGYRRHLRAWFKSSLMRFVQDNPLLDQPNASEAFFKAMN